MHLYKLNNISSIKELISLPENNMLIIHNNSKFFVISAEILKKFSERKESLSSLEYFVLFRRELLTYFTIIKYSEKYCCNSDEIVLIRNSELIDNGEHQNLHFDLLYFDKYNKKITNSLLELSREKSPVRHRYHKMIQKSTDPTRYPILYRHKIYKKLSKSTYTGTDKKGIVVISKTLNDGSVDFGFFTQYNYCLKNKLNTKAIY
jgi:hypothetical protein